MSNGPEELDKDAITLIEKLGPAPQRDPQAAADGRAKFLAEARSHRASVSAASEVRHMGRKEKDMRKRRLPVLLIATMVVGLVVLAAASSIWWVGMRAQGSPAASRSMDTVEVFVAGQNIPVGAVITEDELATISLPQDKVMDVEYTVLEKNQLVGKVAAYPMAQGVVITSPMIGAHGPVAAIPPPAEQQPSFHNPQPTSAAAAPVAPSAAFPRQMVIKNADIRLLVKDTERAQEGVTQIVADVRGYTLSSRVWYQPYIDTNYKWAALTIGVPADQFENAMRRLRSLGVRVLDETASGEDVTNQYVDLQSQLTNLEATRDRIRTFLDQAKTVDEALRVNQQLSEVEGQIEQIKGQMNYLSNRAAFSTITINLEPELPKIVATPTVAPTPTPIAALGPWDAGATTQRATYALVGAYRLFASFFIWLFLVILPVFGPPAVLGWLVWWLMRRRNKATTKAQGA